MRKRISAPTLIPAKNLEASLTDLQMALTLGEADGRWVDPDPHYRSVGTKGISTLSGAAVGEGVARDLALGNPFK
jgi:hypothetical protein